MQMLGLLNTFFDKWAELRTDQIVENSHTSKVTTKNYLYFSQF